jgi:hypothetical protein
MRNGIVEMEENVLRIFLWPILHPLFVEIDQNVFDKNLYLSILYGDRITAFPILKREKQTQIITFFDPINYRIRVGLAISKPTHMEDRGSS